MGSMMIPSIMSREKLNRGEALAIVLASDMQDAEDHILHVGKKISRNNTS